MPRIEQWKKTNESYWDTRKNPLTKKIVVYRNPGHRGYPKEIVIEVLTKEGIVGMKKFGVDTSKKYIVLLFDNSISKNLNNFKTKQEALKFTMSWMRKHPKGCDKK